MKRVSLGIVLWYW